MTTKKQLRQADAAESRAATAVWVVLGAWVRLGRDAAALAGGVQSRELDRAELAAVRAVHGVGVIRVALAEQAGDRETVARLELELRDLARRFTALEAACR